MVDELIATIAEETELNEDDVRTEIEEKEEEFSGLVSEEGAAHLVAKEYGVNLAKNVTKELKIESIVPGMSDVNLKAKVLSISDINTFERDEDEEDGKVRNVTLGDETGTIRMTLWDEQTQVGGKVDEDDVIQIANAYTREDNRDNAEIRVGNSTTIKRINESIDDVETTGSSGQGGYTSVTINEITAPNQRCSITGQVVNIYTNSPFYRVCPECGNTLKQDDEYECPEHGDVEPEYRLALPAVLDDGFGNIRCVFFTDRAKELLEAEDKDFNGDTEILERYADGAEGKRIEVQGRSQYNDFFDTNELLVDTINHPTPKDRLTTLLEEIEDE